MREYLAFLVEFQRFFLPGLIVFLAWTVWRTVFRRDLAVGLILYLGLVIIVDGYLNTGIYLPWLDKGSIRYSEVCACFLFMIRPKVNAKQASSWVIPLLVGLYFGLLFLSALRSDPAIDGFFDYRRIIFPQIVAFLVAVRGLHSMSDYRRFFYCLTGLAVIVGLFTFWDLFFDRTLLKSDMLDQPIYWHNREKNRFGSFFLNPNYLGGFVVLVFPSVFIWAVNQRKPWSRLYLVIGLLALVFSLVETQSRGPLLAFGICLLVLVFGPTGGLSRKRRIGFLLFFAAVFVIFMPGFQQRSVERFVTIEQETATEHRSRKTIWLATLRVIADHPLDGIGLGEKQYVSVATAYDFDVMDNPHNSYLQIAVYAGIPALLAFLFANGTLLVRAARLSLRGAGGIGTPLAFGLAVGIAGFLMCIFPEPTLFTQAVAPVYWLFLGLLFSLANSPYKPNPTGYLKNGVPLKEIANVFPPAEVGR
jgi:O-antigen ligase